MRLHTCQTVAMDLHDMTNIDMILQPISKHALPLYRPQQEAPLPCL